nr:hypothetical protein Itr_chr02CG19160 [Ipomoea trifida]
MVHGNHSFVSDPGDIGHYQTEDEVQESRGRLDFAPSCLRISFRIGDSKTIWLVDASARNQPAQPGETLVSESQENDTGIS